MRLGAAAAGADLARRREPGRGAAHRAPRPARHRLLRREAARGRGACAAAALPRSVRGLPPQPRHLPRRPAARRAQRLHAAAAAHARRRGGDQRALPRAPHGAGGCAGGVEGARQPGDQLRARRGPRQRRGDRRGDGPRPRRGLRRPAARRQPVGARGGAAGGAPGRGRGVGALSRRALPGARARVDGRVGAARQRAGDRALRQARLPAHPRVRGQAPQRDQRAAVHRRWRGTAGSQPLRPPAGGRGDPTRHPRRGHRCRQRLLPSHPGRAQHRLPRVPVRAHQRGGDEPLPGQARDAEAARRRGARGAAPGRCRRRGRLARAARRGRHGGGQAGRGRAGQGHQCRSAQRGGRARRDRARASVLRSRARRAVLQGRGPAHRRHRSSGRGCGSAAATGGGGGRAQHRARADRAPEPAARGSHRRRVAHPAGCRGSPLHCGARARS